MGNEDPNSELRGRDLVGLGALLSGAVVGGLVIGLLVDKQTNSSPTFTLIGIGVGILAGGVGFWVRVRSALRG